MKNSSQTQHHRSKTKKKEEQKMEEISGCRVQAGSREQNSSRWKQNQWNSNEQEAKIRYAGIFAIIAKITVHSKNFKFSLCAVFFAMIAKFRYHSEF